MNDHINGQLKPEPACQVRAVGRFIRQIPEPACVMLQSPAK